MLYMKSFTLNSIQKSLFCFFVCNVGRISWLWELLTGDRKHTFQLSLVIRL